MRRPTFFLAMILASAAPATAETVDLALTGSASLVSIQDQYTGEWIDSVEPGLVAYAEGRYHARSSVGDIVFALLPQGSKILSATLTVTVASGLSIQQAPGFGVSGYDAAYGGVGMDDVFGAAAHAKYLGGYSFDWTDGLIGVGGSTPKLDRPISFDVTAYLQAVIDRGSPYVGFLLSAGECYVLFEDPTTLRVTFDPPAGGVTQAVPEPSALAMGATAAFIALASVLTPARRTSSRSA